MIDQVMDPDKFDRRTHIFDSQGRLIKKNLYIESVQQGNRYLERPVNSGNLWTEGNQPAGRVEKTFGKSGAVTSKKFDHAAPHIEYTPELTGDEKIMYQLEQERSARIELERELAAIRAERNPTPAVVKAAPEALAVLVEDKTEVRPQPPRLRKD